ncbi:MAG TPA: hypothetical protein PLP74_16225 [Quisquiliibacterium sp.]|nr:hypothetical protein [Quisquiliibacterium sp.]
MAEIPLYDRNVASPNALPGVRQSSVASPGLLTHPGAEIQKTGQAIQHSAAVFQRLQQEEQKKEDLDRVMTAEAGVLTEFGEYRNSVRETRRGVNAANLGKDTAEWWNKKLGEYTQTMSDQQRAAFQQRLQRVRLSAVENMADFEAGELRTQRELSRTAATAAAITDAVGYVGTAQQAGMINDAKGRILGALRAAAATEGWNTEYEGLKTQEALHNLHAQVIQRMAAEEGGAEKVAAYFEANKGEMDPAKSDKLYELTAQAKVRDKAASAVNTLLDQGKTEGEGLEWIRQNLEGDAREQARLRWREHWADMSQAEQHTQAQYTDQFYAQLAQRGSISRVDPTILQRMDPKVLVSERRVAEDRARVAAGRESKIQTDWDTYGGLRDMARTNRDKFLKEDLRRHFDKLAPAQREQLLDLQDSLAKPQKQVEVLTDDKQVGIVVGQLGLTKQRKAQFESAAYTALQEATRANGDKPLTVEQRQKVLDRLLIEGDVNGWVPFGGKRLYEVTGTPDAARFMPEVPKADRQAIIDAWRRKRGTTPTEAQIAETYMKTFELE